MSSWIDLRVRNYRFHPEPQDLLRWEAEERTIHRRRLAAAGIFLVATLFLMWAKPHIENTLWLRALSVFSFGALYAVAMLLWRNPFRWVAATGAPGDCLIRTK